MNNLLHQSKKFLNRNGSTILTCLGGVGLIATSVMTAKATPKALVKLDEAREEKGDDLTKLEIVKAAGPSYIPSVLTGAATLACIFGANALSKRHQASLVSAYALIDNSYKEYKKKVGELYGEDADEKVVEEIAKDKYEESEIVLSGGDNQLFYEEFSGRYFEAPMEAVISAEYEMNRKLAVEYGGIYLNEWFELLGLEVTDYGEHLGWSACYLSEVYWQNWIDFEHNTVTLDDGLECVIITMQMEPIPDFENY